MPLSTLAATGLYAALALIFVCACPLIRVSSYYPTSDPTPTPQILLPVQKLLAASDGRDKTARLVQYCCRMLVGFIAFAGADRKELVTLSLSLTRSPTFYLTLSLTFSLILSLTISLILSLP